MASETVSNDVTAIVPEVWSSILQTHLTKTLVSLDVASTDMRTMLAYGDKIHKPYLDNLSAKTYTPGTAMTAESFSATDDTIDVSTIDVVDWYLDDVSDVQINSDYVSKLLEDAAYQLNDNIDTTVLGEVTAGIEFGESTASTGSYITGSATRTITGTSGNIDNVFVDARKALREGNVKDAGDYIAIISPAVASKIELMASNAGFSVADSTLRNGFAGTFLGFQVYVSNNITANHAYIGKRGAIDLVMQVAPKVRITPEVDKIGNRYTAYCLYGKTVFYKNTKRFLDVDITT